MCNEHRLPLAPLHVSERYGVIIVGSVVSDLGLPQHK